MPGNSGAGTTWLMLFKHSGRQAGQALIMPALASEFKESGTVNHLSYARGYSDRSLWLVFSLAEKPMPSGHCQNGSFTGLIWV